VGSPGAGRLVNGDLPGDFAATTNGRSWPVGDPHRAHSSGGWLAYCGRSGLNGWCEGVQQPLSAGERASVDDPEQKYKPRESMPQSGPRPTCQLRMRPMLSHALHSATRVGRDDLGFAVRVLAKLEIDVEDTLQQSSPPDVRWPMMRTVRLPADRIE
jgi:hypothetical protein